MKNAIPVFKVWHNDYSNVSEGSPRNVVESLHVLEESQLKDVIGKELAHMKHQGHLLVRWNDRLFVCELSADGKTYQRREVKYHPAMHKTT